MQINNLSSTTSLATGDLLAVWSTANSDSRKASLTTLISFIESNLDLDNKKDSFTTQYSSPNVTAFDVVITDGSDNIWAIITPAANYANMTITLPALANVADKQEISVVCTKDITTLTIDKNGVDAVVGEPTGITANDYFKLKYDLPFKTWYRVA